MVDLFAISSLPSNTSVYASSNNLSVSPSRTQGQDGFAALFYSRLLCPLQLAGVQGFESVDMWAELWSGSFAVSLLSH